MIIGWVMVGTQKANDSISNALCFEKAYHVHVDPSKAEAYQTGISARSGSARPGIGIHGTDSLANPDSDHSPKLWGFSIQGDERRTGPIYCYARLFTWSQAQRSLLAAFKETLDELKKQDERPSTLHLNGSPTPQTSRDTSPATMDIGEKYPCLQALEINRSSNI